MFAKSQMKMIKKLEKTARFKSEIWQKEEISYFDVSTKCGYSIIGGDEQ